MLMEQKRGAGISRLPPMSKFGGGTGDGFGEGWSVVPRSGVGAGGVVGDGVGRSVARQSIWSGASPIITAKSE